VCPAGGAISFDKNRMLVDGVVVDYQQSQQAWIRGPRIQSVAALNDTLELTQTTQLFSKVQSGQSSALVYQWSASGGILSQAGGAGEWTAPAAPGVTDITLVVTDGNQLSDTATFSIRVVPEINKAPVISDIEREADYLSPGQSVQLEALATDPNNDNLTWNWQSGGGSLNWSGSSAVWTAPAASGIYSVTVTVADEEGLSDQYVLRLLVKEFSTAAPDLVAWYNFSGNANDLTANLLNGQPFNTSYIPDRFGNPNRAVYFNGVNARVTVPVQPVLNFQDGITVSCWIRPADIPAKETFILSHGSWQNRWKLSITPDRHLRWTVNTLSSIGDLDSEKLMEKDTACQVAVTYDGQLLAMYLNGRLHSFKTLAGKIRTTSVALLMGQMLPGEVTYNYKGALDEVKIYNGAMHPDSVKAMYQLGTTGTLLVGGPVVRLTAAPNPATDRVSFSWDTNFRPGEWQVTDSGGRIVSGGQISGETGIDLTVKNWKPGLYVAVFNSENSMARAVFVKE
ncbi:MAG: LamG-like jellyroll fold domain-containing protein, partial [Bacteroidota bacterium]